MKTVLSILQAALRRLAELFMVALALLTLVDVLGRYFLNISVIGSVELTEILMVGVIFTGILLATMAREHVSVDLVPVPFGVVGRRVVLILCNLLAAGISALLGAASWTQASDALEYGDRTTMLNLPLAPVVFFMSIMLFANALVQLAQLWLDARNGEAHV